MIYALFSTSTILFGNVYLSRMIFPDQGCSARVEKLVLAGVEPIPLTSAGNPAYDVVTKGTTRERS